MLEAIVAASRSQAPSAAADGTQQPQQGITMAHFGLPQPAIKHAADFLALPLDVFINESYARILGRAPDAEGARHYQVALLQGRLGRIEVLGRLAYSPEGRARKERLPGLAPAFVLATAYRIPLAGPVLAFAARLLRLPAHWQDRADIEAAALASGSWMKR